MAWDHRRGDSPGQKDESFYGYHLQGATMVREERGTEVPELTRRITLTTCRIDPVSEMVLVMTHLVETGTPISDVLTDSGYSHRVASKWALPIRRLGASHVFDLHPSDRGMHGTEKGAISWNGSLYCPATPRALFSLEPLPSGASRI